MQLEVTQADIDNGIKGDCRFCAVACALSRAYPGFVVSVNHYEAKLMCRGTHTVMSFLTHDGLDWMRRWDTNEEVDPFILSLKLR